MKSIYQISIYLYFLVVKITALFNPKAKLWIEGRKNIFKQLRENINPNDQTVWFHCASLGEFEQGRPIIEKIKEKHPELKIIITFFSPSGYEIKKHYKEADYICYLPLDTSINAKLFLDIIQPKMVFFIKYEFWYFFLSELYKRNIPTYLISAVFRKNQIFFKWYGDWFLKILDHFYSHFHTKQFILRIIKKNMVLNMSLLVVTPALIEFIKIQKIPNHFQLLSLLNKIK